MNALSILCSIHCVGVHSFDQLFRIHFEALMTFWNDSSFTKQLQQTDQYALGDTAFVEIVIADPEWFILVEVALENVWICTAAPDDEPSIVEQQHFGVGGCLSAGMDSGYPQHIVQDGEGRDDAVSGNVTVFRPPPETQNTLRFAFPIEDTVARTKLFVHVQITLGLTPSNNTTNITGRRLLSENLRASQNRHFSGFVGITDPAPSDAAKNSEGDQDEGGNLERVVAEIIENEAEEFPLVIAMLICSVVTGLLCLCCFAVFVCCYQRLKNPQEV